MDRDWVAWEPFMDENRTMNIRHVPERRMSLVGKEKDLASGRAIVASKFMVCTGCPESSPIS